MLIQLFVGPLFQFESSGVAGGFSFLSLRVPPAHNHFKNKKILCEKSSPVAFFQQFWESSREDSGVTFQV